MEIKKVAVLGVGAVGSYLLWGLSQKDNIQFSVIASGERKTRFEKNGFVINGETYKPLIQTPEEAKGVDLLVVAVKYTGLKSALKDIETIVDDHTIVMSLLNGVDSEEMIADVIGKDKLLYSFIKIASERDGNSIVFDPETTVGMIIGEENAARKDRTDAISALFDGTGLHYRITDTILPEIWSKYRLNVSYNLPQAILQVGLGAYKDSEHVDFIRLKLREEVETIAKAKGVDLSVAAGTTAVGSKAKKMARYSTLQDIDAKRHTEIDMFAGAMIRMGKELGIPTPYSEIVYHMIKALEEKNDGKFNYDPSEMVE